MIEQVLAALIAATCAVLLVRLGMGERRRHRLDAAALRAWHTGLHWARRLWNWRSSRRHAARVAEDAIRRARGHVERDGNVYKPKSFRGPRKPH